MNQRGIRIAIDYPPLNLAMLEMFREKISVLPNPKTPSPSGFREYAGTTEVNNVVIEYNIQSKPVGDRWEWDSTISFQIDNYSYRWNTKTGWERSNLGVWESVVG